MKWSLGYIQSVILVFVFLWISIQLIILSSYEKKFAIDENELERFLADKFTNNGNKNNETKPSALKESIVERDVRPRIVILAGPHKAASTTIQVFLEHYLGLTVALLPNTDTEMREPHEKLQYTNWVWPIGVEEEYRGKNSSLASGFSTLGDNKFYAPLASLIGGKAQFFDDWEGTLKDPTVFYNYFRMLLRRPWEEGKNIVFGSEEFDSLIQKLHLKTAGDKGEALHVAPESSDRIDQLLDVLPWDNEDDNSSNSKRTIPSLRLEDIEVVITHRTPRIRHLQSLWAEVAPQLTFREFLASRSTTDLIPPLAKVYHSINSLALALQFARKGLKTTIVDLKGVMQREAATSKTKKWFQTGGLNGVVACDILKMDNNGKNSRCDDHGRFRIKDVLPQNIGKSKTNLDLDEDELSKIEDLAEEYDCGLWYQLRKYQARGTLRILYQTKDLFATCRDSTEIPDLSFGDLVGKVRWVAQQKRKPSADPKILSSSTENNNTKIINQRKSNSTKIDNQQIKSNRTKIDNQIENSNSKTA